MAIQLAKLHDLDSDFNESVFKVCVPWDDAIDKENSDLEKYMKTRDAKHLKFLPGKEPSWFVLRNIPKVQMASIVNTFDSAQKKVMVAFQYALMRVENVKTANGASTTWEPSLRVDGLPFEIVGDKELQVFDVPTIYDIGSVAFGRAFLVNGSSPKYTVPHTSIPLIQD